MKSSPPRNSAAHSRVRRRHRYFYAEADAGAYDVTIDLVVPLYRELHRTVLELARGCQSTAGWEAVNILDVGSGTGVDALALLRTLPDPFVVAVDCCAPMHAELRSAFRRGFPDARLSDRIRTITTDIVAPKGRPQSLIAALPSTRRDEQFHLAVSCFALHHLDHAEKREAFRRMFDCLAPGGAVILGDLFTYQVGWLARAAHEFDLNWIRSRFQSTARRSRHRTLSAKRLTQLRDHWLQHYMVDNILEPIEQRDIEAAPGDSLTSVLYDVGFRDIACPFRYWQVGVLMAHKPTIGR